MESAPAILVFDSGLGGLTVFREVVKARPDARFVYAADDAFFPYGRQPEPALIGRVVTVPFVGTVPAIKPACSASNSKLVSVLGTEATVKREYTRALVREHGNNCAVTLVGSPRLAELAEAELKGETASDADISAELAPCFVESGGRRTDTVVLACTHYPLLLQRLEKLALWPVKFIDPAPAIARRVVELLGPAKSGSLPASARPVFTSGRPPAAPLAAALAGFGLAHDAAPAGV
jgi:glutamate racemase